MDCDSVDATTRGTFASALRATEASKGTDDKPTARAGSDVPEDARPVARE
jgi:hypothetical protein